MPSKPKSEDPIVYATWKLNCMKQLKQELESMFDVIERKVSCYEKVVRHETDRFDDDKLLTHFFADYQDNCRLSKHRLTVLLNRDVKKHEGLLDELLYKKKAWEDEL